MRYIIIVGITFLSAFSVKMTSAEGEGIALYDGFDDGDYENGPVAWDLKSQGEATMSVEGGDLVVTPAESFNALWVEPVGPDYQLQDASVRTQVRLSGSGQMVWLWAQAGWNDGNKWVSGTLYRNGNLRLEHEQSDFRSIVPTDFRVAEEDVVLQLDVVGTKASLYAWRPGELMPETPQASLDLPSVQPGILGGGMNGPDAETSLTFRYLWFASEPIRDEEPAAPELKIERDAVLLSYLLGERELQLESKTLFRDWEPELEPSVVVDGRRKIGFSKEEAKGKEFRLTGPGNLFTDLKIERNALLLSYEVRNFDHWRIESHPILEPKPGARWQRVEAVDLGNVRRAFVPVREPIGFFRMSLTTDEYFLDEFSNQESPVRWAPDVWLTGTRERTEEGWEWTPVGNNMSEIVQNHSYDDASIHTQFRLLGPGDFSGGTNGVYIWARSAYLAGISANGSLLIWTQQKGTVLTQPTDLDVDANNDIHLQLDYVGDVLRLWAWEDGAGKPEEPQISFTDKESLRGSVGLFYNPGAGKATIAFRSFELTRLNAISQY